MNAASNHSSSSEEFRIEKDSMGEMKVPLHAYYGASTQRAVENFPISGILFSRSFIQALGLIKKCAAGVNLELGLLDAERAGFIISAAEEVEKGRWDNQFVVDIFQTGSGTSTNMNANEVISTRAKELAKGTIKIHPNDHVNMCQSSNDVIPAAIHVALAHEIERELVPALETLGASLQRKAKEFAGIVKTGRTHLQDATPVTLGQEFGGYASQVTHGIERLRRSMASLLELPLGGTAVGSGLNTHPDFAKLTIAGIAKAAGLHFVEARDHFEAQAAKDALVEMSGQFKTIACSLTKMGNDIRWLGSGPCCGLGEIQLPSVQPGSSIMPAKVNPVIVESLMMACAQVIGNDTAVTIGNHAGSTFELNVMMPLIAHNILQSASLLTASARNFAFRCVDGVKPSVDRLYFLAEASIAICTALAPKIGYDKAAELAKEAFSSGKSLREVAKSRGVLPDDELDRILDLMSMTKPGL